MAKLKSIFLPEDVMEGIAQLAHQRDEATTSYVTRHLVHVLAQLDRERREYWLLRAKHLSRRKARTDRSARHV